MSRMPYAARGSPSRGWPTDPTLMSAGPDCGSASSSSAGPAPSRTGSCAVAKSGGQVGVPEEAETRLGGLDGARGLAGLEDVVVLVERRAVADLDLARHWYGPFGSSASACSSSVESTLAVHSIDRRATSLKSDAGSIPAHTLS